MGSDGTLIRYHPSSERYHPMTDVDSTNGAVDTTNNGDSDVTQVDTTDVTQVVADTTDTLSPRQREVYDLHKSGMKNTEIAVQLDIAPGTVSNALVAAKTRLGEVDSPPMGDISLDRFMQMRLTQLAEAITQLETDIDLKREEALTIMEGATTLGVELDLELVTLLTA